MPAQGGSWTDLSRCTEAPYQFLFPKVNRCWASQCHCLGQKISLRLGWTSTVQATTSSAGAWLSLTSSLHWEKQSRDQRWFQILGLSARRNSHPMTSGERLALTPIAASAGSGAECDVIPSHLVASLPQIGLVAQQIVFQSPSHSSSTGFSSGAKLVKVAQTCTCIPTCGLSPKGSDLQQRIWADWWELICLRPSSQVSFVPLKIYPKSLLLTSSALHIALTWLKAWLKILYWQITIS